MREITLERREDRSLDNSENSIRLHMISNIRVTIEEASSTFKDNVGFSNFFSLEDFEEIESIENTFFIFCFIECSFKKTLDDALRNRKVVFMFIKV